MPRGSANKKTPEQFVEEFKNKGLDKNIEMLSEYVNFRTKIKLRCKKCGKIWSALPEGILRYYERDYGCKYCSPFCGSNGGKKAKSNEQFLIDFSKTEKSERYEILSEYTLSKEKIKIRCKNCGKEYNVQASDLLVESKKLKCRCQITDEEKKLWSQHLSESQKIVFSKCRPDLVKYFADPKDADLYSPYQDVTINIKCLNCGHIYTQYSEYMLKHIKECPICGNKVSRPNRFIHGLILELKEYNLIKDYKFEYIIPGDAKYRYDAYILTNNNEKILIECQGGQHYLEEKNTGTIFNSKKISERDKIKRDYALNNNYIFIELECKQTEFEYMKDNLFNTKLNNFIDLYDVDWTKVEQRMESNFVKQVCDYYNSHKDLYIYEIAKQFNTSRSIIMNKLKLGAKLGWTDYTPENSHKRNCEIKKQRNKIKRNKINNNTQ